MLTRKQYELLMFIHERVRETGIPPSFDEMKDALDLKSKSGIHRLITALEERGFLRRMEKRARALEIMKLPDNVAETLRPATTRSQAQRPAVPPWPRREPDIGRCPRCGQSAARRRRWRKRRQCAPGRPHRRRHADRGAAEQDRRSAVPGGMIGRGDHYALEVTGDSMINAGILDGDTVIIQEADTANTGEIVVALVDNQEATLKRLRRRGDSIALEAANPAYETRLYGADRVRDSGQAGRADPAVLSTTRLGALHGRAPRASSTVSTAKFWRPSQTA